MGPILDTPAKSILYDLSNCSRIDPGTVLLFFYAIALSAKAGRSVHISGQGEPIAELFEHFRHYHSREVGKRSASTPKGMYTLRGIHEKTEMLNELQDWAESVREGTEASPEQVALWQMQIAEVTTNAFQHGPVHKPELGPPSVVAGKADGLCVQLAALDFGSTIPRVIRDVAKQNKVPENDGVL